MKKIILIFVFLLSMFLLTACGIEVDQSSKKIFFIGNYNSKYYFTEYNQKTENISIGYFKDNELYIVETLSGYYTIGLIGNQILLRLSDYEARSVSSYQLFNLDTLEYTSIDSTADEGFYNVCYYDENVIVFYTFSSNPMRFLTYDISSGELIGDISISPVNYYSYIDVYYENNKLYINLNYPNIDVENFDYIYDLDNEIITTVNSNMGNYMVINEETLLFLEGNFTSETKGLWVDSESIELSYFLAADYGSIKMYDNFIIEDQVYNKKINLLNQEFTVINQIDLDMEYSNGMVISERELLCKQVRTFGSLIKSQQVKIIIYDFITETIIIESDWMDVGSQLGNI
ncbi:MAG: hypothetical protein CVV57_09520 [Tenericutes bacterium HGW-Tenericutes-2]|jgi:hypothetical protein|nr:MAG: hypothetical protein CVV57_09520 [Tenericutes bacterium HGW-Tenericutes-2]